jgi:splicing factor 3A subunit 1
VGSNIPAGLPPQPTTTLAPPPPPPPPATDSPKVSGIPMADAMLNAGSNDGAEAEETKLLSESDFIASLPRPEVTLQIRVPNDPTQIAWNFHGQILSLTVNALSTIKQVKTDLSQRHLNGMPINKVQLKDPGAGFYNNNDATLAYLNIGPTATLELLAKTRGGRR